MNSFPFFLYTPKTKKNFRFVEYDTASQLTTTFYPFHPFPVFWKCYLIIQQTNSLTLVLEWLCGLHKQWLIMLCFNLLSREKKKKNCVIVTETFKVQKLYSYLGSCIFLYLLFNDPSRLREHHPVNKCLSHTFEKDRLMKTGKDRNH